MLVAGLHGNEQVPIRYLTDNKIDFVLGNPMAFKANKRFIDNDLNASFGLNKKGYEYRRAKRLLDVVKSPVIDFHTFSCDSEPFAVIVSLKMLPMASRLGVKHVLYMNMNIKKGHSLIDHVDGVSVEVGHHDNPNCYHQIKKTLLAYRTGLVFKPKVYEVYGKIKRKGKYTNFKKYGDFYPVLAGEKAYNFPGLKAKLMGR